MADLKQLKITHEEDYPQRDPLVELTRIMGVAPRSAPDADDFDDFGIDLEAELLGAFEPDEATPPQAANTAVPPPMASFAPFHDDVPAPPAAAPAQSATEVYYLPHARPSEAGEGLDAAFSAMFEAEAQAQSRIGGADPEPAYRPADAGIAEARGADEPSGTAQPGFPDDTAGHIDLAELFAAAHQPAAWNDHDVSPVQPAAAAVEGLIDGEDFVRDFHAAIGEAHQSEPEAAVGAPLASPEVAAVPSAWADWQHEATAGEGPDEPLLGVAPLGATHEDEPEAFGLQHETGEPDMAFATDVPSAQAPYDEAPVAEPSAIEAPSPAGPVAGDAVFDPFAELAAMAAASASRLQAAPPAKPVAVVEPAPSRLAEPAAPRPDVSRIFSRANIAPVSAAPLAASVRTRHEPVLTVPAPGPVAAAPVAFAAAPVAAPAIVDEIVPAAVGSRAASDDLDRALDEMIAAYGVDKRGEPAAAPAPAEDWSRPRPVADEARPAVQPVLQPAPIAAAEAGDLDDDLSTAIASAWDFDGPDIETVDVPEQAVEPSDELDIPDLAFEDDLPVAGEPDELEMQFAHAFEDLTVAAAPPPAAREMASTAAMAAAPRAAAARPADDYDYPASYQPAPVASRQEWQEANAARAYSAESRDWPAEAPRGYAADVDPQWQREDFESVGLPDEEVPSAFHGDAPAYLARPRSRRRGLYVAALVAGVAVIGGTFAFMMTRDGGNSEPVLVKADAQPVKVRPETPGGVTVPNQDKAVYDRVAGSQPEAPPTQEVLVSRNEEPVQLNIRNVTPEARPDVDDEPAPAPVKAEDRVAPSVVDGVDAAAETPVVAPRRVRTMVVKPDGTLVPREEPATVAAAPEPAAPAAPQDAPVATGTVAAPAAAPVEQAPDAAAERPAPAQPEPTVRAVETAAAARGDDDAQRMPQRGPVAPARPSDQPVDIVGNTTRPAAPASAGTQVAAVAPAPAPVAAAGGWAIQIASQPSPEGAQASYADLARRYGGVIGGRGVSIVKADIPGKGTFYRVRIPAQDKAEANALCERYKAAGGSCFVAR